MSWASNEVVEILTFLLPGFVAAAVFYPLTSHPKPSTFASVVQALIFTMIVQAIIYLLPLDVLSKWLGSKDEGMVVISVSVLAAVALGLVATWVSNHDKLHAVLRWLTITRATSYPSEWYSSFVNHEGTYVVLHLEEERRLYGWLEEWPSSPERGHFRIAEASWLYDDSQVELANVTALVIPVDRVEMVEFIQPEKRDKGLSHG